MVTCARCRRNDPHEGFFNNVSQKNGLNNYCKPCWKLKIWEYKQRPERRARMQELRRAERGRWKAEAIAAYGGKCVCWGESVPEFLSIDHINGGGTQHRKKLKRYGSEFCYWLKGQGWPKDEYRLLCHNCNQSLGYNGYCPHSPDLVRPVLTFERQRGPVAKRPYDPLDQS